MIRLQGPLLGGRGILFRPHPYRSIFRKKSSAAPDAQARTSQTTRKSHDSIPRAPRTSGTEETSAPIDVPMQLWYHRLGPASQFISWFDRTQGKRPLLVQFCTSLTVYLFGDLLAQKIGGEEYDWKRTGRMLIVGGVASLPGYKWFLWLGRHFNYASKLRSIATKVVVQQIVFAPIFNTYFFGMQALLSGQSPAGIVDRITKAVPESIYNSIKLWPAVTAFVFTFVQPQYRFMIAGVVAVFWQSYLSWLNQREAQKARLRIEKEIPAPVA